MSDLLLVSGEIFTAAPPQLRKTGLLGWVTFVIGHALQFDGVAVRRTRNGRLTLSFPVRHDSTGRQHSIVRPTDAAARREIESQVFAALGLSEESAP